MSTSFFNFFKEILAPYPLPIFNFLFLKFLAYFFSLFDVKILNVLLVFVAFYSQLFSILAPLFSLVNNFFYKY